MAREIPYIQAIGEAVHQEMARDETVIYFGQNLGLTEDDPYVKAFGGDRVRVTPISETAEIGMAVGAAFAGFRPVVQLYMAEFMLVAMDQVVNEAPRFYGMSGGEVKVPIVLQAGYGFTAGWAGQHTGTIYGMFMGVPGPQGRRAVDSGRRQGPDDGLDPRRQPGRLLPQLPPDARARRRSRRRARRPARARRRCVREGGDVTIVGIGWTVGKALAAAEQLAGEGIEAEVIDPRTLAPLDTATIIQSVEKTGRLVVVDQATRHASAAAVIAAEVAAEGFSSLKAPIGLVTALDATIPYSQPMEEYLLPDETKIVGRGAAGGRLLARRRLTHGRRRPAGLDAGVGLELLRACGGSARSRSGSAS